MLAFSSQQFKHIADAKSIIYQIYETAIPSTIMSSGHIVEGPEALQCQGVDALRRQGHLLSLHVLDEGIRNLAQQAYT